MNHCFYLTIQRDAMCPAFHVSYNYISHCLCIILFFSVVLFLSEDKICIERTSIQLERKKERKMELEGKFF